MRVFGGLLKADLRRSIISFRFLAVVLLLVLLNTLSVAGEVSDGVNFDVMYLMLLFVLSGSFVMMSVFLGVIPYGHSFCEDWTNQFIRPCMIRSSPVKYGISKVIAVFVSAALAVFTGYMLTALVFSLKWDFTSAAFQEQGYIAYDDNTTIIRVMDKSPLLYLGMRCVLLGFSSAFWAVFALCVSTYVTNTFTTYAVPVIAYYLAINIFKGLPPALRLNVIMDGRLQFESPYASFIYGLLVFTGLSVLCGIWFCIRVKRRLARG